MSDSTSSQEKDNVSFYQMSKCLLYERNFQLVAEALRGSAASIHSLSDHIDSAKDYDVDLCVRLSPLIHPARIPSNSLYNTTTYADDPNNTFRCATATFCIITQVHRGLKDGHPSKPRLAQFLRDHLEIFYRWIEFLCAKRILLGTASSLIGVIALTDDQLLLELMGSSRAFELALSIWKTEDDSGRHPVLSAYKHYPILYVVMGFNRNKVGKTMFKAYLVEAPRRIDNIANTIRARAQQLVQRFNRREFGWDFALQHLLMLMNLSRALLVRPRGWTVVCGEEDLLNVFTTSLRSISAGNESTECWKLLSAGLFEIYGLTFAPGLGTYPALLKVVSITKGGILPLLISCAERFPSDTEEFAIATAVIKSLAAYAFYHEVSKTLTPMTFAFKNELRRLTGKPQTKKLGLIITTAVSHASTIHDDLSITPRQFCDAADVCSPLSLLKLIC
jgi:hypothetical protein